MFAVARWIVAAAVVCALGACDDGPSQTNATQTTPTGGAGGTITTSSGGGGTAPACTLGELGSCGADQKCSVIDEAGGEVGCVDAGSAPPWSACNDDGECRELSYCDGITGVCKPLCDSSDDCGAGRCLPALIQLGDPISGLSLCTADCDPVAVTPCDASGGVVSCVAHNPGDDTPAFDCVASAGGGEDAPCTEQTPSNSRSDCGPGLACAQVPGGDTQCKRWCFQPGSSCGGGEICADTGLMQGGMALGVCP